MKNSPELENELKKLSNEIDSKTGKKYSKKVYNDFLKHTKKIWPICFLELFNALPTRIRSMFGTFEFKLEIYTQKLHEARFYHKFALLNSQSKFFIVKNSIEMFKLNLIMYHWQFRIYFD